MLFIMNIWFISVAVFSFACLGSDNVMKIQLFEIFFRSYGTSSYGISQRFPAKR